LLARSYAAEAEAPAAQAIVPDKFKEDWKKIAPNYDLPHFPSEYMNLDLPFPQPFPPS